MATGVQVSQRDWELHTRLMTDYPYFARHVQKIEFKDLEESDLFDRLEALRGDGQDSLQGTIPLIFNPGQWKLHHFLTEMKQRRGLIRAAIVKPRQVGWSTLIQGRAHWLATKTPGLKIFIIAHNAD